MITIHKNVGETPLELIDRLRIERPELKDETLSYAGRLDPMVEGQMLILVGEEENKNREAYMGFDKEYVATFLIGVATDTGDVLGLIQESKQSEVSKQEIEKTVNAFTQITSQTYPWFSAKTVHGKKLFDHFKEGNPDNIQRPELDVKIHESELLSFDDTNKPEDIQNYIVTSIQNVNGDFRQQEIIERWETYFKNLRTSEAGAHGITTIEVRLKVGTGTYIRALTEAFDVPVVLLKLNRTKIFV
jgi:tRNA pseudouridine(55) synthase